MPWLKPGRGNHAEISHMLEPKSRHVVNMVTYIIYINEKEENNKPWKNNYLQALPWDEHMNTGRNNKQTTCLCRDTGGKGTLQAQRTSFNTLDNWDHETPTQSKMKKDNRKEKVKGS